MIEILEEAFGGLFGFLVVLLIVLWVISPFVLYAIYRYACRASLHAKRIKDIMEIVFREHLDAEKQGINRRTRELREGTNAVPPRGKHRVVIYLHHYYR